MTDSCWQSVFASRHHVIFKRKYENNSVDDGRTKTEFQVINLHINTWLFLNYYIYQKVWLRLTTEEPSWSLVLADYWDEKRTGDTLLENKQSEMYLCILYIGKVSFTL